MSMGILWGWRWWRLLVLLLVTCSRSEVDSLSNTAGSVMQGHGCYKARHVVILGTKVMARNELYEKDMASCEKACIENANCTAWSYKLPKEMKFLKIPEPPDLEEQLSAGFDDNDSSCYLVYKDDLIENLTMRYSFGATLKFKECSEVYVGCLLLEDNPSNATLAKSLSTRSCLLDCKESNNAYAGLKNASGCVCGNAFGDGKFVDNSQCQIPCPMVKNDLCGGKNATSIWRTGTLGNDDACIFGPVSFVNFSGEILREYSIGHCVFHCTSQDNCVAWQHNGTHCSLFTDDLDEVKLSVGMEGIIAGFGNCYDNLKLMYHTMIELPALTVQIFNGTIEASHLLSENGENITLWEPDTSNQATGRFLTQAWMSKDRSGVPQILSTWDAPNFFNQHPLDFSLIWTKNGTTFWKPVCPPKYTALGSVSTNDVSEIPSKNFSICLHESVIKETQTAKKVWVQNESGDSVYIFDVFHNDSALPSLSSFIATRSGNHSNPLLTLRKVAQDAAVPTRYTIHAKHKGIFDTKLSTNIHLLSLSVITNVTRNVSSNRTTYHMKRIFVGFLSQEDLDHDWTSSGTRLSYKPIRSIRVFRRQKGEGITPPKGFESIGTIGVHIGKIDHSRDPDKLHIIRLICPDGFHALGVVALLNDTVFNSSHYSCIHEEFLGNVSLPKKPWWPVYTPLHNVSLWRIYPASCFEDYLAHSLATMGSERPSDTAFMLRKHKEGDYEECSSFSYQVANMKTNIRRMERQRRLRLQRAGSSSGWGRTQYSHSGGAGFTWLGGQGGETTGLHEYGEEGISFDGVMGESEQSSTFEVEKTKVTYRSRSDAASGQNAIDIPDLRIVSEVRTLPESSAVRTTHQVSTPRPLEITDQVTSEPLSGITAEMVLKGWACFQMRHFAFYATPIDAADINGIRYKDVCVSKCRRNGECLAWSYILDKYDKNGNFLEQSQCHHLLGDNDISNLKIVFVKDAFMEFLTCDLGYIGCFKDAKRPRDLPNPEKGNRWTADTCQEACALKGYAYFGLQFGGECWCGNSFGKYPQHSSDSACSIKCRAKPTETCGSMDMNSLYRTGNINGEMCLFAKASLEYRNLESTNFKDESIHNCWGRCKSGASDCVMWEHNGTHCHHISQSHLIDSGQIRLRPSNLSYVGFRSCDTPTGTQFYRTNSSMEMSVKLTHDVTDDVTITTDEKENLTVYSTSLRNLANKGYFLLGQSFRNSTYVAKIFSGEPLQTPNDMHEVLVEHVSVVNRNQTTADRGPGAFASFWHMDCPSGYSALGDVISPEVEPPNPQHYKCVHNDFLHAASIGEKIWARTEPDEISLWRIAPKSPGVDLDLSFFKVTDHAASIKDDELFLKTLKKVANEDGEYYYTAQDTFEFESKQSEEFRDFNIFSDGERNGGNIRISKQANLEDGWFYLGFGQPLTTDGGRKTPIAKNIQGQSIKKPTDIQQIASLPGELFFKQRARNVSLWRPICPQNYKSLSDVFQIGDSKPTLSNLACVHQNLLVPARTADMFWEGNKGNVKNGSYRYVLAHIMPQDCEEGEDYGFFRAMKKDDDIEVYTLMRTSGDNSLYSQCTNWVPPTQMVYTTQEPLEEMILSFEDIVIMGGMRQAHLLIKDAAINAQSSQNHSDINICRGKCENNTECRIWSFDNMGAVGMEQDNCYHTFFNSNMSDVTIEYKLGAISQTHEPIEAAESCMLRNSTILYDIAAITLSRENFTTADCKKSCLGCAVWLQNDSHCVILQEENLQKSKAIVPKSGHSVGFPQCNFGSDFYTYIAQTEHGGRDDSMVMEVKEFSMTKSYLILKNKTGRLFLWNPDLTHDEWKVIGQKIDMGTHSHDDKILAARTITGTPIATPISASTVASVTGYRRHHHEHRGKESNITVWRLICPEGYHPLGHVTLFDLNLNLTNYACIKDKFVAHGELGAKLFSSDSGSIYEIQHRKDEDGTDAGFYSLVMSDTHAENPVFVLKTAPDGVYYSHGDDNVGVQTTHTVEWKTTTMVADDPVTTSAKSDTTLPASSKATSTMTAYAERDTTQPATSKTYSTVTSSPAEQTTTVADDTTPRISTTVSSVVTSPPVHSTLASSASTALMALPTQSSTSEATETTERNQGVPVEILPDPDYPLPPDLYADLETFLPGLIVQDLGLWGCFWKHNAVIKGPNATLYNNLDYGRCKDTCKNNIQCQIWSLAPKDANDLKQGSKCYHVYKDDDIMGLEISTMKYAHLGFKCSSAYVGCHTGKSEKDVFHFSGNAADEYSCLEKCKDEDYPYSGFQRPNRCTCGNSFDDSLFVRLKKGEKCNLDEKEVCEGCKDNMRYAIHTTGSDDSDHKLCIIGKNVDYLNLEEEYDYEEVGSVLECRSICLKKEEKECWMWSYNYTHCRMIAMSKEMSSFVPCDNCLMGFRTCNEQGKANFVDLPGGGLGAMHNNECATEISFLIAFLVVLALLILALIYICCQRRKKYKQKAEEEVVSQSIRVGSRLDSLDLNWPKKKKTKVDKSHRKAFRRSNLPVLLHLSSKKEKSQVKTETGKIEAATDITGKDGVAIMATDNGGNKIATSEKIISDADVHHHAGEANPSHRDLGSDYITIEGNLGHPHGSSAIQSGHAANSVIMAQYAADSVTGNRIGRGRAMSSVTFNVNQPYHSYDITPRALTLNENNSRKSIVAIQYQPKYNKVTAEQRMSVGSHSAAYHEVRVLGGNNQGNGIHTKQNITSVVEQYGFIPIGADKDFVVKLDSSSGSIA